MKFFNVNSSTYINFNVEKNDKDPKLKINGHVRISKYRNIFPKDYSPNCSEEVFAIKIIKNTVPLTFAIADFGTNFEKNIEKEKSNRVESWKSNQERKRYAIY